MSDAWKFIQEDKVRYYRYLLALAPLHRTPSDRKSAGAMQRYEKKLVRQLERALPWEKRRSLPKNLEPGKVVVLLSPGESPNIALYKGATIAKEK